MSASRKPARALRRTGIPVAVAVVLVAVVLAMTGCGTNRPTGPAGIVGVISTIDRTGGQYGILVLGGKQATGAVADRAFCRITSKTTIVDSAGKTLPPGHLKTGMTVAVWFTGPVAESYPVQGTAAYIEVRSAAD